MSIFSGSVLSYLTFFFFTNLRINKKWPPFFLTRFLSWFNYKHKWFSGESSKKSGHKQAEPQTYSIIISSHWKEMSHGNFQCVFIPNTWTEAKCEGKSSDFSTCMCAARLGFGHSQQTFLLMKSNLVSHCIHLGHWRTGREGKTGSYTTCWAEQIHLQLDETTAARRNALKTVSQHVLFKLPCQEMIS